ncbi:cytochrome b5-like heme/steroid binding domain containing protein, putative [Leishmania tarentolae]|uniref:Cytochrome b5-like heme/steroid binding domain containing protein, putative n=1 Tax=Leishmania tarentolae TaxID=5689 RepID=A0A640KDE2_LEITA|nr:cytochrome b5-like heme/steroid binding domain containing protein, putative [Leishmania tarentolae]
MPDTTGSDAHEVTHASVLFGIFLGFFVILFMRLQLKSRQRLAEAPRRNAFVPRAYTVEELAQFDGKKKPEVFVGVKGIIYNASLEWYGPEGPYSAFAGCDSSRQLGKVIVGREEINADWTTLAPDHLQMLHEWEERFRSKYPAVGWITDPNKDFVKRATSLLP